MSPAATVDKLGNILDAYQTFAHAVDTRALKVIIEA